MDDLEGEYPVRIVGTGGGYSPLARVAIIEHDKEGYYNVYLQDERGETVDVGNRARYRIEGALEGPHGYDIEVNPDRAPGAIPDTIGEGTVDPEFDFGGGL